VAGSCDQSNKLSDSLQGGKFIDQARDFWLLENDLVPWFPNLRSVS